jgi:hypothetical protein
VTDPFIQETYAMFFDFIYRQRQAAIPATVTAWRDDLPWPEGDRLLLDTSTFPVHRLFPEQPPVDVNSNDTHYTSPCGTWGYRYIKVLAREPMRLWQGKRRGDVWFTEDTVLGILHEGGKPREVWMSITPAEIFSCRPGVRAATGRVVLGGLGLGWMLEKIHDKKTVKEIIVVEKSQELLDWYGTALCAKYPKVSSVVREDVFTYAEKCAVDETRWVLDIWQSFGSAADDLRVEKMRKRGMRVWAWGESAYGGK